VHLADGQIPDSVPISSQLWLNIDELMEVMWEKLNLVRVYTKPRGQAPDYSSPVVLRRGKCTVEHFCNAIHKDIAKQFKAGTFSLLLWPYKDIGHRREVPCRADE
jgi:ribosome-interacting GTPase 1